MPVHPDSNSLPLPQWNLTWNITSSVHSPLDDLGPSLFSDEDVQRKAWDDVWPQF